MAKAVVGKYLKESKVIRLIDHLKQTGQIGKAQILSDLVNARGDAFRTLTRLDNALLSACEDFQP